MDSLDRVQGFSAFDVPSSGEEEDEEGVEDEEE